MQLRVSKKPNKLFYILTGLIKRDKIFNSFFINNKYILSIISFHLFFFFNNNMCCQNIFVNDQLSYERVAMAELKWKRSIEQKFTMLMGKLGDSVAIRVYKQERVLEVWVKSEELGRYTQLCDYNICESSGILGPKRKEGDFQTPEGIYYINVFNPESKYHLSLGIDYPNASDLIFSDKERPGGDIYIHGDCVTIGCIPLTDKYIEELYLICMYAKNNGQNKIPVMIFPMRMNTTVYEKFVTALPQSQVKLLWNSIRPLHDYFETHKNLPEYEVGESGYYKLTSK